MQNRAVCEVVYKCVSFKAFEYVFVDHISFRWFDLSSRHLKSRRWLKTKAE